MMTLKSLILILLTILIIILFAGCLSSRDKSYCSVEGRKSLIWLVTSRSISGDIEEEWVVEGERLFLDSMNGGVAFFDREGDLVEIPSRYSIELITLDEWVHPNPRTRSNP